MIWTNLLKPKIYVGIIVCLLMVLGVYLWTAYQHNLTPGHVDGTHGDLKVTAFSDLEQLPPIPDAVKRKWAAAHKVERAKMAAEVERRYLENRPQMVAEYLSESYPDTEEARSGRAKMLAALDPIDEKSEAEIIQIIMDFFPENVLVGLNQNDILLQLFTNSFHNLSRDYENPEVVLSLVYDAQFHLTGLSHATEELEIRKKLRQVDPDKYYELEMQETLTKISDTEADIRNAESMGRPEWAESRRNYLESLQTSLSSLESDQAFEAEEAAYKAERAALDDTDDDIVIPGGIEGLTEISERIKKRIAELEAEAGTDSASASSVPGASVPSESAVSSPGAYDPVRSFSTTQASLAPWRSTLDQDYLDVLVSRSMSAEELKQQFPTQTERDQLKSRTTELRKAVVSKIRTTVNGIQGATSSQKRELARKLATSNFDSEFAESVLLQLDFDDN